MMIDSRTILVPSLALIALLWAWPAAIAQPGADVLDRARPPEALDGDLERVTGRLIVVHFWASWCIPCRAEMSELAEFRRHDYPALAERGIRIVTVSNDVRDIDLQRFAENVDLVFPLYYDPYGELTARYEVRGLPATVVLDRAGRALRQFLGAQPWRSPSFQQSLLDMLPGARPTTEELLQSVTP